MGDVHMVAVDEYTGQPVKLSAEAARRAEAALNSQPSLEGLVAFANANGDVRFAAAPVPYFSEEWYEERMRRQREKHR